MKQLIFIFLSIVFASAALCQKEIKIVDSLTGKGLPFATVECFAKSWGLYSDSVGNAIIPDNMLKEPCKISFVGYQSKELVLENIINIQLNPLPQKLQDITVVSCKETVTEKLEIEETKEKQYLAFTAKGIGCLWGVYVPNTTGKSGYISTLGYNRAGFSKDEKLDAPVRLRFFEYDSITHLPKDELSVADIMITAANGKKIVNDIISYKIYVPESGIVVAFEMFDAGQQYHYMIENNFIDGTKRVSEYYGWALKAAKNKDVIGFSKAPGKPWRNFFYNGKMIVAPAVKLEIKVCK